MSTAIYETPKSDLSNESGQFVPLTKKDILFSFQGRIGRFEYWMSTLAIFGGLIAPMFLAGMLQLDDSVLVVIFIAAYIPFIWISLAIQAKRWHDRNKSAWWILITFIPVIGAFWAFVENGFMAGTDGPNHYGFSTNSR